MLLGLKVVCCAPITMRRDINWKRERAHMDCQESVPDTIVVSDTLLFSCSVMSKPLWPHRWQHTRLPCPSLSPGLCSNSPLSQRCHPNISSSVVPFSSCLQPFPASGFFPMSQLFWSGGQSTGISALASVLPMNIQDWSPVGWTVWIFLQSKGFSRVFSNTTILWCLAFFIVHLSHPYMTTGNTIALTRWTFVSCGSFSILKFVLGLRGYP